MKNRVRQRENRRKKEERIAMQDYCGIKNPTPFSAVKSIVAKEKGGAK